MLGEPRAFCCAGCEAVAQTIVAGGFQRYYETRSAPAERPGERPEPELPNTGEAALILEGVRCAACLWLIEEVLGRVRGVTRADLNYATQRAHVLWNPQETTLAAIVAALRAVGYDAMLYEPLRQEAARRVERRAALWRLFVAGFGAMQVMMYAFPAYVSDEPLGADAEALMRWAGLIITVPVLVFACRPFFEGAWRELRTPRMGLETPIALGLAGGFAASAWATLTGSGAVYFDSISMLAFLLLAARYAQAAMLRRAAAALDRLMAWSPSATLRAGERVTVAPGQRLPADGVVEAGISSADESLLTGEARAVPKRPGDLLLAGSVNLEQPLAICVTRAGADTQAAAIARLADRAAASRPRLVETADRIARPLTGAVLIVALAAGAYWGDVWVAVAVLVASCPCALGLAAPIVLTRANAWLLGRGALVTRSGAHQALDRVTDVMLDKTGTLTLGRPGVSRVTLLGEADETTCIELACALEATSRHPLARAFRGVAPWTATDVRHFAGEGIEGWIEGRRYRIGSRAFCAAPADAPGSVFLAGEGGCLAAFEVDDTLRPDAAALVAALRERGIEVHLASGDDPARVAGLARRLGIPRWQGALRPQAKQDYVAQLQDEGRVVAMVGDGLNDTPVLAAADVSFAMGAGADAAQLQADVILTSNSLAAVVAAVDVANRAMRLVRENFAWALAYNAAALPIAAAGWIGPWQAALGMAASSIAVLLNASRPLGAGPSWKASTSSSRSRSLSYS
jgi:Cu2+-exporting ATPase